VENILVVEDDPSLSEWIFDYLTEHGFQVTLANRGDTAIELIEADMPDLVLLDIMLPEKNGFEVCKEVRKFYPSPILMVTACSEESDEILGLELGADDYINKPVRPRVLLARIKSLLRRNDTPIKMSGVKTFGGLELDEKSKSVNLNGEYISISANEFEVLWLLAENANTTVLTVPSMCVSAVFAKNSKTIPTSPVK